jgi:hypothetical protein
MLMGIAGDDADDVRRLFFDLRRCMTSSPASLLRSPAMHDIIAGVSSSIARDA